MFNKTELGVKSLKLNTPYISSIFKLVVELSLWIRKIEEHIWGMVYGIFEVRWSQKCQWKTIKPGNVKTRTTFINLETSVHKMYIHIQGAIKVGRHFSNTLTVWS